MQSVIIQKNDISNLKMIPLSKSTEHGEGDVFLYLEDGQYKVIKKFHFPTGIYFSNKLFTINTLIELKNQINIPELIIPEKIVTIGEDVIGYSMPYVKGETLYSILKSDSVSLKGKIEYLKQIGMILEKLESLRAKKSNFKLYLNDVHENNFMVDENGKLFVVDMDFCSIMDNIPFGNKYVSSFGPLDFPASKYPKVETYSCGAEFIPSANTDLYCYNIIILNFLFGINMNALSREQFDFYFNYLTEINTSKELIDAFSKLYTEEDNVNIYNMLDSIYDIYDKTINAKKLFRHR